MTTILLALSVALNAVLLLVLVQAFLLDRMRKERIAVLDAQRDFYKQLCDALISADYEAASRTIDDKLDDMSENGTTH